MKLSRNKSFTFAFFAFLVVASFAVYFFYFQKKTNTGPKVQKSINEILEDRTHEARNKVSSDLGQAIVSKNWVKFDQIYKAETQYKDLADIIRGAFIQNSFAGFLPEDFDALILRVIQTFKSLDQKQYPKLGLLISQFNRLPTPQKNSEAYKNLRAWLKADILLLKRLALFKMVGPDSDPDPAAVKSYIHGFTGDTYGLSKVEWIRFTEEIRNVKVRKECMKELSVLYPSTESKMKPIILNVLSKEPSVETAHLIKYTLSAIHENDTAQIEAGLKAVTPLLNNKLLDAAQKQKILARLSEIPSNLSSSFIQIKGNEIKSLISSSP